MRTFAVSDVPLEQRLLDQIALERAVAWRIAEPPDSEQAPAATAQPSELEACACTHELVVAPGFD